MESKSSSKTVKTIGFMAIIIFCAKFMGLLREMLIAGVYGQGYEADVINTSTQIPLLFFDMTLGVAILSTFVPVFNKYLECDGRKRAEAFANNFMTVVMTIALVLALIGMVFAEPVVGLMVPGYDAAKTAETAKLLRILFPSIVFTAAAYTAVGILQSFGEFNVPSLISVVSNLIMILYLIIAGDRFGLNGVIISMVVAWASQLFIQLPFLKKKGYRYRPAMSFRDEGIKEAARLALPVLISSWVQPLCVVINMSFSSSMGDGSVSGLNWANKIYIIMVGVFAYAITNFIFPKMSRQSVGADDTAFAETTRSSVGWIVFIIGYVSAMFVALNEPVIRLVFERGAFTAENTAVTANALFYYSFGMVGYAVCEVMNKSFYAIRDGKTPMYTAVFGVAVNFIAAAVFVKMLDMGIGGLAFASAVSSIAIAIVLLFMINKRKQRVITFTFVKNIIKIIVCGIVSGAVSSLVYSVVKDILGNGFLLVFAKLCVSAIPGLVCYILAGLVLQVDEIRQIRRFGREQ